MTPLTEDGREMVRSRCGHGWCDPDCAACNGSGIGWGYLACQECFLSNEDYTALAKESEFCPRREEA